MKKWSADEIKFRPVGWQVFDVQPPARWQPIRISSMGMAESTGTAVARRSCAERLQYPTKFPPSAMVSCEIHFLACSSETNGVTRAAFFLCVSETANRVAE
ncbi:hypothetical protein AXF42_Ash015912 [Apostasia shenzhenica]|uniref:Uncharacterized protein n=1 Tax=Apostasia shenzhenica TaxID=1088818 RepID=A0A2I0AWD4_9ASPA|nr:hypothetical protein AXF42_Ash015912 [Apostasia shenzhenica]